jgi:hypothetical protein
MQNELFGASGNPDDTPEFEPGDGLGDTYTKVWGDWQGELVYLRMELIDYQWRIGDLICKGEQILEANPGTFVAPWSNAKEKNALYRHIAKTLDISSTDTVKDYAYVARNVAPEIRQPKVSFQNHKAVAGLKNVNREQYRRAHANEPAADQQEFSLADEQAILLKAMATGTMTPEQVKRRVRYIREGSPEPETSATRRAAEILRLAEPLAKFLARPYAFNADDIDDDTYKAFVETLETLKELVTDELKGLTPGIDA